MTNEAFRYFQGRELWVGNVPVTALRLSYVGELGWELYTTADMGTKLWDTLWAAGQQHGLIAAGRSAFGSLRLEKGYRSWGARHDDRARSRTRPGSGSRSAWTRASSWGRRALEGRSEASAARRLVPLTIADRAAVVMGKEPVEVDGRPAGYVTSAAYGYSIDAPIAYAWLPTDAAHAGQAVTIRYFGEAVAGDRRHRSDVRPGDDPPAQLTAPRGPQGDIVADTRR